MMRAYSLNSVSQPGKTWATPLTPLALSSISRMWFVCKATSSAPMLCMTSASIFHATGDSTAVAWTLNYLGDLAQQSVDSLAARAYYEQSLAAFRTLGDGWGIASTLCDLGRLNAAQSKHEDAERLYGESIRMF